MKKKRKAAFYGLIGFLVASAVFFVEVWAINWRFLIDNIFSSTVTTATKWAVLASTGESFRDSFPLSSQVSIVILAFLAGIYGSLLVYYVRQHYKMNQAAGLGIIGSVLGSLGLGCGACGSVILSTILGGATTAMILNILPFKGVEFSILGAGILGMGIFFLVRQLRRPVVCRT